MTYRKLRIAWSVAFGIAAVLLIVLWVRSFVWDDNYDLLVRNTWWGGGTHRGTIVLNWIDASKRRPSKIGYACMPVSDATLGTDDLRFPDPFWGFYFATLDDGFALLIPIWLAVLSIAGIGAAPWLKVHFRLRTVLIVITLVAILMGWNVWAIRFVKPL